MRLVQPISSVLAVARRLIIATLICFAVLGLSLEGTVRAATSEVTHSTYVPKGYELAHHDEFDSPSLDERKWLPKFLPHWSDADHINGAKARYIIDDGQLKLRTLTQDIPWSRHDAWVTSGIMTGQYSGQAGSKLGLHEFGSCRSNPACVVWPGEANTYKKRATFKYGYYEMKARACLTNGCAWWMVGFEDDTRKSGEIDVIEVNHDRPPDWQSRCSHFGIHPWDDPHLTSNDHIFWSNDCAELHSEHVYGLLWTEREVTLFVDGVKIGTLNQSPQYQMAHIINVSRGRERPATGTEFAIDYFRVYQRKPAFIRGVTAVMAGTSPGWGHEAAHAVDGKRDTYAQSATMNWNLELDLQRPHMVERLTLLPNRTNYPTSYRILAKQGADWIPVYEVHNGGPDERESQLGSSVSARHLRLEVLAQAGSTGHAIHEVEVFGRPDLLTQKPVTMLNGEPGWGWLAGYAVDGDDSTYAQSTSTSWDLRLDDFGAHYLLSSLRVVPNWSNYATEYILSTRPSDTEPNNPIKHVIGAGNRPQEYRNLQVAGGPAIGRYGLMDVRAQAGASGHALHEVQLFGAPNVADGMTTFMTEGDALVSPGWGHVASHATDGDFSTYAQTAENVPWDLTIDLGQHYRIKRVAVKLDSTNPATSYTVRIAPRVEDTHGTRDEDWTPIDDFIVGQGMTIHTLDEPQLVQFVRLNVSATRPGSVGHAVREVLVFEDR